MNNNNIINIISKKLSKTVTKLEISDTIDIIGEWFIKKITNKEPISIKNFGSFITYIRSGSRQMRIDTREYENHKPSIHVRFIPSDVFLKILRVRKRKES